MLNKWRMSPSPVSALSLLTVTRWCRCRLCSQPRWSATAFRIWAVAPQPFSDACGRSPSGLCQEMLAGLLILLRGHSGILLLCL